MRRNWPMIVPPYSREPLPDARSTNASRPRSWRVSALLRELLLDDVLRRDARVVVAGLQERVEAPHAVPADERVLRASSCSAWPMCSSPVTFGGGNAMTKRLALARAGVRRRRGPRPPRSAASAPRRPRACTAAPSRESLGRSGRGARRLCAAGAAGLPGTATILCESRRIGSRVARRAQGTILPAADVWLGWPGGKRSLEQKITRAIPPVRPGRAPRPADGSSSLRGPEDWTYVWLAVALTFVIAATGILVPWSRLARWTYIVPPLAYFVVVALLREASDGSVSGYAPLALLPVVWIALNLGRAQVAIGIAVGTSVFVLPLIVGDPESYTTSDWQRAVLWAAVAAIVGFSVESLMRDKRAHTRQARDHERTMAAIARCHACSDGRDRCANAHLQCDARASPRQASPRSGSPTARASWSSQVGRALIRDCRGFA